MVGPSPEPDQWYNHKAIIIKITITFSTPIRQRHSYEANSNGGTGWQKSKEVTHPVRVPQSTLQVKERFVRIHDHKGVRKMLGLKNKPTSAEIPFL